MMGDSNELDHLENLYEMETFERGGRDLWDNMNDPRDPADVTALVVEACRVKDRLDRLHRMATRDGRTCVQVVGEKRPDLFMGTLWGVFALYRRIADQITL
ncbi:hypothetical protein ACL1BC_10210 [Corynebacterium striatum]